MKTIKKVGLALGSGGFRGFALVGVLKALEENNIPIDFISGASIGSVAAAHYAVFQNVDLLKEDFINNPKNKLPSVFDLGFKGGLVKGDKLKKVLDRVFDKLDFSQTKIPLRVISTDLANGKAYVFKEGKISFSLRASCTIPVIFEPIKLKGHCFVDGGLSDPVPIETLKEMGAELIIAVNLYHKNEFISKRFNLINVALRSTRIALYNLAQASIKSADIVIAPDVSSYVQTNDFKKYSDKKVIENMIENGYKETLKCIPEIIKQLS